MIETAIASETISIEKQSTKLIGAALSLKNEKPSIDSLYEVNLPDHVKPLYMDSNHQKLSKAATSKLFIGVIPSEEVLQRRIDLTITKEKDIIAVLPFEAEPLLPFPIEDAVIDRLTLEKSKEGTKIQLYASKKEDIKKVLDSWNVFQLDPEWIVPSQSALAAFAHAVNLSHEPCFIVHLAHDKTTTCLAFEKTILGSAVSAPFIPNDGVSPQQDLLRILLSLSKQNPDLPPVTITFVGELSPSFNYAGPICSALQIKEVPPKGFDLENDRLAVYALPIGAALLGLPGYKDMRINLRKEELAYPSPLKRYMKPVALYLGLCSSLGLAIAILGNAYIANQEVQLRKDYVELLAQTGKTYDAMESRVSSQVGYIEDPSELSMEDLNSRLQMLDNEMKSSPSLFPLQPNVPQVSDVFAWISHHPAVTKGEDGPLTLESLSYSLIKRPELKKMAEKYRVKIEIEFSSPTPKAAREFHDALLAPNEFVDSKDEIKWSSNRGKYRASFYLKDKTNYRN